MAQGSAIETLKSFSALLKTAKKHNKSNTLAADIGAEKMNIGIIGLHSLRPFDTDKLIELLRNNKLPDCLPEIPGNPGFHRSFSVVYCYAALEFKGR